MEKKPIFVEETRNVTARMDDLIPPGVSAGKPGKSGEAKHL
jgi:hypothetical protein